MRKKNVRVVLVDGGGVLVVIGLRMVGVYLLLLLIYPICKGKQGSVI